MKRREFLGSILLLVAAFGMPWLVGAAHETDNTIALANQIEHTKSLQLTVHQSTNHIDH